MNECQDEIREEPCDRNGQRQLRLTSLMETATNIAAGYGLTVAGQLSIFPVVGLDATLRQALQVGALFTARSLVRSYALGRLFERLGARGFSSSNRVN